jgi:hypothetical protein
MKQRKSAAGKMIGEPKRGKARSVEEEAEDLGLWNHGSSQNQEALDAALEELSRERSVL